MKRISLLPVGSDVFGKLLCLAFAAVVGSFLVTNFIVQRSSTAVDALSEGIIYNSAPSIEHLASIRREVLEAELILSRFIHEPTHRSELEGDLEQTLARVKEGAREYLMAIEHNAARGRDIAESIRDSRYRTMLLANGLNAICGVLAVGVAWLLHREARTRRALFDAHTRSLEQRAAELEQFAGRVAHDIRNPLFAARMAAELALRKGPEAVQAPVHRIIRSLSRADEITGALLDFARSGAKPDPGARTEPRTVIADLLGGFEAEVEQAGISLHCEPVPPVLVACSTGVYLSLLGNLVRNAIKYMGDAEVRRITLRVAEQGGFIRTEVRDTGPGIAPESLALLFEPYFRGKGVGTEGLGLGLATVKKLAESHGGQVGVASERGSGSTFWFELQRAGSARELSTTGDDALPPRQQAAQH